MKNNKVVDCLNKVGKKIVSYANIVKNRVLNWTWRDMLGLAGLVVLALLMSFGLGWHVEGIFFWLFFVSLFYWRIDSRLSIGLALAGLVLIMLLLALDGWGVVPSVTVDGVTTVLVSLNALAEKVAVWVYFFLVIGVVKQIWEYKAEVASEGVESNRVEE